MKEIIRKLEIGEFLYDHELSNGLTFFTDLEENLLKCGESFHLARAEATRIKNALLSIHTTRESSRKNRLVIVDYPGRIC